jgi:hypothetical protein
MLNHRQPEAGITVSAGEIASATRAVNISLNVRLQTRQRVIAILKHLISLLNRLNVHKAGRFGGHLKRPNLLIPPLPV